MVGTSKILPSEQYPTLPVYSWETIPFGLHTQNQWKKSCRKVRKGEKPVCLVRSFETTTKSSQQHFHCDGSITHTKELEETVKEAALFDESQTTTYRGSKRTWAINIFNGYFATLSSNEEYIWRYQDDWISCKGKLKEWHLENHLKGESIYGIRGARGTRFLAIDLDLHNGNPELFMRQLRILLDEFHRKDGWHLQVANKDAGGVHLIRVFRDIQSLDACRRQLRQKLERLDAKHPELNRDAHDLAMSSLGELEIFPDPQRGFRLPLCRGRTMLLDKPLERVQNNRMRDKPMLQDVVGYVSWIMDPDKQYMPTDDVLDFVKERLRIPVPAETTQIKKATKKPPKKTVSDGMASLGKMKGRYADVLIDFWNGNGPPDSLNKGIRLLALVLPYYFDDEDDAVELIEDFIDELPDESFSDRLSSGDRDQVSRVVRNTVKKVYNGLGGQPNPELSRRKLDLTFAAWRKRGFNPTDKSTWNSKSRVPLAGAFSFSPHEICKLTEIQHLLKVDLETTCKAVKYVLRLVKGHAGEIAINFVKKILKDFGIACGSHTSNKANHLLRLLREWNWIYVRSSESWYGVDDDGRKQSGRARAYGIGTEMNDKFPCPTSESCGADEVDEFKAQGTVLQMRRTTRVSIYCDPSLPSSSLIQQRNLPDWLVLAVSDARGSPRETIGRNNHD